MSEREIYEGCLALMGGLVDRFEEYLKKAGIDQTAAGKPFRAEVPCAEIVRKLFLADTDSRTAAERKCEALGIREDYIIFDFSPKAGTTYNRVYEANVEYNGDKERINRYLAVEPSDMENGQSEDETISVTARFANGFECDVKCCGVQYREGESNLSWTEAVLFDKKGAEVACSEPDSRFFKTWEIEHEGDLYKVHVS